MDILIESTKDFEKDLEQFTDTEKFKIIKEMNQNFELLSSEHNSFYEHSEQLRNIKLNDDYDSTIYCLKISNDKRVILTIDDDPIFACILITLFRLVNQENAQQSYNAVAEMIYQDFTVAEKQPLEIHCC
ncbi:MAG: hypothetical protein EAZ76_17695 [Nostocales cyanobacterium]|nr:MAG: hypothetical protein EAZ87_17635 [Nostocales cyanobacterium]TAF07686.1 MAG: hypothetical protein EAZ76_17695 [Nostocales cyanobacterium]